MPQIDYNVWIESEAAYTGLNTRTGTSAITDIDYDKFAPFKLAYYPSGANHYTLWNWINGGELSLDTEIDKSMCYVGIYNSDLPQLNIAGYAFDTYDTIDNPLYKTDNTQIQAYFCYDTWNFMFQQTQIPGNSRLYGDGRLYDKDFTYFDNRLQIYKGGIVGAQPHISPSSTTNLHDWLNVYLSFGIKSLILEINVAYKTGDGTFYPDQARCTLATYEANSAAWKESHPIIQAYCIPYIRGNSNGTYSNTGREFETYNCNQTFTPAFTLPYLSQNSEYPDIVTYTTTLADGQSTRNGYFPLYGAIVGELALSSTSRALQNMGILVPLMGINRGTLGKRQSSGYMYYWLELDGSDDDNIEWIRCAAAAYGLFFCDDIGTLANAGQDLTRWIDNNMMLGTIDEDGRTNGDYTRGVQNVTQRQWEWSDTTQSPYDPSAPPVPQNHYSDTTTFNTIGNISTLTRRYALDGTAVENLGADLWTITEDLRTLDPDEDYKNFDQEVLNGFLTTNPIDCVVSLRRFPLTLPYGSADTIKLGKFNTNVSCYAMNKSAETYSFEGTLIAPQFGDSFLDYNPYTKFELYVPFCGTVELNPADILNRTLNVKLVVDFDTGTCTAYVLANNLCIETLNGSLAIDIPVTGTDATTVAAQIFNGIIQARQARQHGVFTNLSKAFTPRGLMSNIYNVFGSAEEIINAGNERKQAEYSISHTEAPVHVIGSASPVGSWAIDLNCRLIIYYPTSYMITYTPDNQAHWSESFINDYAQNTGFAVCQNGLVEYRRGLVIAANPLFSGVKTNSQNYPATQEELALIEQALQEGVISPGR